MKQITSFWTWFQDNEEAIKNAVASGINTKEVFLHLNRNYQYISKKISFIIISPSNNQEKYTIIFTADGHQKLFPKIIALEDQAPKLQYFMAQAFIKPIQDKKPYLEGTDKSYVFKNYKIKISQIYMALVDYNIATKKLNINVYVPSFDNIKPIEGIEVQLKYLVIQVIGEIAFQKHINKLDFLELKENTNGLLKIIELQEYIKYLCRINSI